MMAWSAKEEFEHQQGAEEGVEGERAMCEGVQPGKGKAGEEAEMKTTFK